MKRDEKVSLFHQECKQDFDGAGNLVKKKGANLYDDPIMGSKWKMLKIPFKNISKIEYIALIKN